MAIAPKIEFKCDKCGKSQPKDEKQSNQNWNVYDQNQKCECGGTFKMHFDGKTGEQWDKEQEQQ